MPAALNLRTNLRIEPLGVDTPHPEFDWQLPASAVRQVAYQVQVSPSEGFEATVLWDSGRVSTDVIGHVVYGGAPLRSSTCYFWRLRVWCEDEQPTPWASSRFETAKLDAAEWRAAWITNSWPLQPGDDAAVYFRTVVHLPEQVERARAYVSALGWYRLFINGHDLTGPALVPRFTPLQAAVEYQTYDVSGVLRPGANVIAIAVGDGRYRGRLGFLGTRCTYGDRLGAIAQIEVRMQDGHTRVVTTNELWHAGPGRIVGSDPQRGERIDLRIPDDDWLNDREPPDRFRAAQLLPDGGRQLIAEEVERVQAVSQLAPVRVWKAPSGRWLVDLGQNIAGVLRIRLQGKQGQRVQLTHSELLTPEGELDVSWIWHGKKWYQRDEVILSDGTTWVQPWFTIHGFRYVEVDGIDGALGIEDVQGIVLSSALRLTGSFACSDERLNKLHQNIGWSLRSNFTDVPTDCPTRERSGWTGDIQVFAPMSTMLVDGQAFLRRYLRSLALEQLDDGRVPPWIPVGNMPGRSKGIPGWVERHQANSVGWGDVAVMLPWTLYRYYGDRVVLQRQYDSMKRWVDHMARTARKSHVSRYFRKSLGAHEPYLLDTGFHWGEWLRPGENDMDHVVLKVLLKIFGSSPIIATAYFAQSSRLLSLIAKELDCHADERHYRTLSDRVRVAWHAAFVRQGGRRIGEDKQDDYVRAIAFDLLTDSERREAVARLVELVSEAGDHLGTGFLSTAMLLPVLADNGHADVAYRILMQTSKPSWLYQVEHGATTTWETWDGGYDERGKGKHSHNHYALGSAMAWLQEGVAGLSPLSPGYRRIRVAPYIGGGLKFAKASIETPFGRASSAWRFDGDHVALEVCVPPGSTAEVHTPDRIESVGPGTHAFRWRAAASKPGDRPSRVSAN